MRKKLIIPTLAVSLLFCGCVRERLYRIEPPFSERNTATEYAEFDEGEVWLAADCEVVENEAQIYSSEEAATAMNSRVFRSRSEYESAAEISQNSAALERTERFDDSFFKLNMVCCTTKYSSGGAQYKIDGVSMENINGENVVNIYASYSTQTMCNCGADYTFFVKLSKAEAENAERVQLLTKCRDLKWN